MRDTFSLSLNDGQKEQYRSQPDHPENYTWTHEGDYEISQYVRDTSLRFWYNTENLTYDTHWHEAVEMIIALENNYEVIIQEQTFVLHPGDIFIIPPGFLHSTQAPASGSRFVFLFEMKFLRSLQGFSYITALLSAPILINNRLCPAIYKEEARLIMQLADCYWGNSITKEIRIYSHLMAFFSIYADYCTSNNSTLKDSSYYDSGKLAARLTAAFDYLEHHFQENLSLDVVADAAGFSKFHFSRIFKECTGKTFHGYLTQRRIKAAEQLLMDPNLSITDIALQCGFGSHPSFNRIFKQCKGCTPTEFRQLHIEALSSGPM